MATNLFCILNETSILVIHVYTLFNIKLLMVNVMMTMTMTNTYYCHAMSTTLLHYGIVRRVIMFINHAARCQVIYPDLRLNTSARLHVTS